MEQWLIDAIISELQKHEGYTSVESDAAGNVYYDYNNSTYCISEIKVEKEND